MMTANRIIFSTDLHGRSKGFRSVMGYAAANGIDKVVFGGDINPKRSFLRFKDGIIVPESHLPKGVDPEVARKWFKEILALNAGIDGDAEKILGVSDAYYPVEIRRGFKEIAIAFEKLCIHLHVHLNSNRTYLGRLSADDPRQEILKNPLARKTFITYPESEERTLLLEEILPLVHKCIPQWLARAASEEELLDAYLSSASGVPFAPPGALLWKDLFYRSIPDAIKKAFKKESVKILQLVEDWGRTGMYLRNVERGQLGWIRDSLLVEISSFVKGHPGREVFIMPGNDDTSKTLEALEKAESRGILKQIHGKVVPLDGNLFIGGYSFVSDLPSPMMQDWQKGEDAIQSDLESMFSAFDRARTILSIHVPPAGGLLDLNFKGEHIGSAAVRRYLESTTHPLILTGHVHEIVSKWGNWQEMVGHTMVMTPGATHVDGYDALIVDLNEPANSERIKIR